MRYLLVILLFANSVAYASGTGQAAWFAANWFKQQQTETKTVDSEDDVVQPIGMDEYVKACTELTSDKQFCKKNWIDARMAGSEVILVPVDRTVQVRKSSKKIVKPEVRKVAKAEVKVVKYTAESKVKGVNLLDVSNEEYKARRAAVLAKPNAIVMHETYR